MGEIAVHEFITVDGVVENPGWTADYPFAEEAAITAESAGASVDRSESGLIMENINARRVAVRSIAWLDLTFIAKRLPDQNHP